VVFTFLYATLAAKSRRAEMVLIPLLDILQSVPILGFLTFTVVFFLNLFPGQVLGAELACVFAIFTSQAWNMTFSMYQSIRNVPKDLEEASQSFHLSGWQRFWRLDVPFAMPGLIWNAMMSMSGGWFFVVDRGLGRQIPVRADCVRRCADVMDARSVSPHTGTAGADLSAGGHQQCHFDHADFAPGHAAAAGKEQFALTRPGCALVRRDRRRHRLRRMASLSISVGEFGFVGPL
jgi:hypothetical protein